jgi:hypothetical protein
MNGIFFSLGERILYKYNNKNNEIFNKKIIFDKQIEYEKNSLFF